MAEHVDANFLKILENIEDVNVPWKTKRELTIKLTFAPNEDRDRFAMTMAVTTKMPGLKPLESDCFITRLADNMVAIERENPKQGCLSFGDDDEPITTASPTFSVVGGANKGAM